MTRSTNLLGVPRDASGACRLSRSAVFPTLLASGLRKNPGFRGNHLARGNFSAVPVEVFAVQLHTVRLAVQSMLLFLGLCRLRFGFLQSLLLRLAFKAQSFG